MNQLTDRKEESKRVKGSLFGFFVGDALGVPVEFVGREVLKKEPVTGMREYGTHGQPAGTWSDDSSMVIATMDSIIRNGKIDYNDMMASFLRWYDEGEYTPNGEVFDIGIATSSALSRYRSSNRTEFGFGSKDEDSNGNGSLMRILPISLYLHYSNGPLYETATIASTMTHMHFYSTFSCVIYTFLIDEYLKVLDIKKAYSNVQAIVKEIFEKKLGFLNESALAECKAQFGRLIYNDIASLREDEIVSGGFVIDSLESCIWCLLNTDNYKDAVLKAVNLGGDTDTIGALTGGLAGLIYGYDDIPKEWVDVLKRKDYLDVLVDKFSSLINDMTLNKFMNKWAFGLGDMRKYYNGEDPMPKKDKKADANSWNCKPLSKSKTRELNLKLTKAQFDVLSMGHIPEAMEDHWFMYCDDDSINYFRSWTGIQIFKAHYRLEDDGCVIYLLEINDNKEEYNEEDETKSIALFLNLIMAECGIKL